MTINTSTPKLNRNLPGLQQKYQFSCSQELFTFASRHAASTIVDVYVRSTRSCYLSLSASVRTGRRKRQNALGIFLGLQKKNKDSPHLRGDEDCWKLGGLVHPLSATYVAAEAPGGNALLELLRWTSVPVSRHTRTQQQKQQT